jgi:hypothetical protein
MTIIPPKLIVINEMFSLIIICNGGFFSEEAYLERKILAVHFRSSLCSLAACTSVFISTKSAKGGQNSKSLKIFEQKPDENDISMVNSPVLCTPSSPFNATLNRNCCHKYNGTTYPNGFLQSPHMFLVPFVALEIADRDRKKKKITTFFFIRKSRYPPYAIQQRTDWVRWQAV